MSKKRASVKWFNDAKGIGFLTTDKGDVFVHYKNSIGIIPHGVVGLQRYLRVLYIKIIREQRS